MDRAVTFKQEETSGHEPQPGLDTKSDRLTDRQSQCDFDFGQVLHLVVRLRASPEHWKLETRVHGRSFFEILNSDSSRSRNVYGGVSRMYQSW
jgi:hypothetical protein